MDSPVPFPGTPAEAAANYATHCFAGEDGRCLDCDSKPWHVAASYPCGVQPPRMEESYDAYLAGMAARMALVEVTS